MIKRLTFVFGIILLIEIFCGQFVPELTFINGTLRITNRIIGYLSFTGFLFFLLLLLKVNKEITIFVGLILLVFLVINSIGEIHPIDTTTEFIDIATLNTGKDGKKTIVRECFNVKTNGIIRDTLLVKDFFIFRYIY